MPGRASNCSAVAVLMLIFCPGASLLSVRPVGVGAWVAGLFAVGECAAEDFDPGVSADAVGFCFFSASWVAAVAGPKVTLSLSASNLDGFIPLTFSKSVKLL